jgi:hypothetical protein
MIAEILNIFDDARDLCLTQAHIERDLIIARTCRVQFGWRGRLVVQIDVHVSIFESCLQWNVPSAMRPISRDR